MKQQLPIFCIFCDIDFIFDPKHIQTTSNGQVLDHYLAHLQVCRETDRGLKDRKLLGAVADPGQAAFNWVQDFVFRLQAESSIKPLTSPRPRARSRRRNDGVDGNENQARRQCISNFKSRFKECPLCERLLRREPSPDKSATDFSPELRTPRELEEHIRSHLGYRAFACGICEMERKDQHLLDTISVFVELNREVREKRRVKPASLISRGSRYEAGSKRWVIRHIKDRHLGDEVIDGKDGVCDLKPLDICDLVVERKIPEVEKLIDHRKERCARALKAKNKIETQSTWGSSGPQSRGKLIYETMIIKEEDNDNKIMAAINGDLSYAKTRKRARCDAALDVRKYDPRKKSRDRSTSGSSDEINNVQEVEDKQHQEQIYRIMDLNTSLFDKKPQELQDVLEPVPIFEQEVEIEFELEEPIGPTAEGQIVDEDLTELLESFDPLFFCNCDDGVLEEEEVRLLVTGSTGDQDEAQSLPKLTAADIVDYFSHLNFSLTKSNCVGSTD